MSRPRLEHLALLGTFLVLAVMSGFAPFDRADWYLEIAVPVGAAVLLVVTYPWFQFTPLSYRFIFLEAMVLVVGAHYTHEHVPLFDWLKQPLGWQRNHYDRFAHFAVGVFLAIPFRELIIRFTPVRGLAANFFTVIAILAMAAFYEITEWWIAELASPEIGAAYLGSQGDIWDAQKDMFADLLGAIVSAIAFARYHDRQLGAT